MTTLTISTTTTTPVSNNSVTLSVLTSMSTMDVIYVSVTAVASSLSVIGCIIIIWVHVVYRMLRTTGRAMLVQLTIADMLTAIGNILGVVWYLFRDTGILNNSEVYCSTQSAWTIFSSNASFFWTTAIALAMSWAIISNSPTKVDRYWTVFLVVCWGVPALVTTLALAFGVVGYDPHLHQASWCWIDPHAHDVLFWTFFTGKAWELSASLITAILYTAIKVNLCRHQAKTRATTSKRKCRRDIIHEANVKLTFVPLVFIALRMWGTARFLLGVVDHDYASSPQASWIVPLQGCGDSAQGFANFIMHCFFTSTFRKRLLCGFCGKATASTIGTSFAENPRSHSSRPAKVSVVGDHPTIQESGKNGAVSPRTSDHI